MKGTFWFQWQLGISTSPSSPQLYGPTTPSLSIYRFLKELLIYILLINKKHVPEGASQTYLGNQHQRSTFSALRGLHSLCGLIATKGTSVMIFYSRNYISILLSEKNENLVPLNQNFQK